MPNSDAGQIYRGNLDKLIAKVADERSFDLGQYRRQYLERRIAARLRSLGLHSYRQYADHLDADPGEYTRLIDALTINVTDFYRDPVVFDIFRDQIVPGMLAEKTEAKHRIIKAWSAGCATGEETYSITMSILEGIRAQEGRFLLSVVGTDLDEHALQVARAGVYDAAKLDHIPEEHQVRYTEAHGDTFEIRPEVRQHVKFRPLNLFSDKPIHGVDVLFCRNVFIYFSREQQEAVLERFWPALAPGGYLVLGRSEKLSKNAAQHLELVNGRERIYRKPKHA